jgi:hypothetical protein
MRELQQMKKFLIVLKIDVADEGDVGLIKVVTQKVLDVINTIHTGFGNIEGKTIDFDKSCAIEITDEELAVLKKFNLTNLQFGDCCLSGDDYESMEDDDEDFNE